MKGIAKSLTRLILGIALISAPAVVVGDSNLKREGLTPRSVVQKDGMSRKSQRGIRKLEDGWKTDMRSEGGFKTIDGGRMLITPQGEPNMLEQLNQSQRADIERALTRESIRGTIKRVDIKEEDGIDKKGKATTELKHTQ
jgi:hypothetical protein